MTILNTPNYRAIVQDNLITAKFEDALRPALLFRSEAASEEWGDQTGDSKIFTGNGLIPVTTGSVAPLAEPSVASYGREQWTAQLRRKGIGLDTHAPTSSAAAQNLVIEDVKALGINAGTTIARLCRNALFNAAVSGHTVANGAQGPAATLRVVRLNGFTRARRPDLPAGSPVRFDTVSANNPLAIRCGAALATSINVIGFTPDFAGDEIGPGVLTLSGNVTVNDRDPVVARSSTWIRRAGGGNSVGDIGAGDLLTFSDLRSTLARLANMDVPRHSDGFYHGHMSPISKNQIFGDAEWRQMNEGIPDGLAYSQFVIGRKLGAIWYDNNECPQAGQNVNIPSNGSTDGADGDQYRPTLEEFAPELWSNGAPSTGIKIQRVIITGGSGLREYYVDQDTYVTAAGTNGKISDMPQIGNGSIEIMAQRVKLIQLAPIDRWSEVVRQAWKFVGDFVFRTDAATGDAAYFKRCATVEHAEP